MSIEWKAVAGFPAYEVSNDGQVRRWLKKKKVYRYLKGSIHKQGYRVFFLSKDGETFGTLAHRLVGLAFIPNPNNYPNVCHNDGKVLNNHHSNLRWDTQVGNLADTLIHNTGLHGVRAKFVKMEEWEVRCIKEMYAKDSSHGRIKDIAEIMEHPYGRVRDILIGKTWGHIKIEHDVAN